MNKIYNEKLKTLTWRPGATMEYLGDTAQAIQAFRCEMWPLTYTTLSYGYNTTPVSLSFSSSVQFKWEGK